MRGLKFNIKCVFCRHKKVCHEELGEIQRLRGIIEELKLENEEYERQIQIIQHERILLQNENVRLKYKETVTKVLPTVSTLAKANIKKMLDVYVKQVGCKTCIGCGECYLEDDTSCSETIYRILENHFNNVKYDTGVTKEQLNAIYGAKDVGYIDTDSVRSQQERWKDNIMHKFEKVD